MILTWIAIGIFAGTALAAIITYWNEIVDWAKRIVAEGAKKAKLAIQYINGKLIPNVVAFFKGEPGKKEGETKPLTPKELREWGEAANLTEQEIEDLINGKTILRDVD